MPVKPVPVRAILASRALASARIIARADARRQLPESLSVRPLIVPRSGNARRTLPNLLPCQCQCRTSKACESRTTRATTNHWWHHRAGASVTPQVVLAAVKRIPRARKPMPRRRDYPCSSAQDLRPRRISVMLAEPEPITLTRTLGLSYMVDNPAAPGLVFYYYCQVEE